MVSKKIDLKLRYLYKLNKSKNISNDSEQVILKLLNSCEFVYNDDLLDSIAEKLNF